MADTDAVRAAQQERMAAAGEELERKAHGKEANAAMEVEQAQRVQQERMRAAGLELERKAHAREADAAMAVEQAQRIQQEAMMGNVLPQLERNVSARTVDEAAEVERQERISRDKLAQVEEELRRRAGAQEAERLAGVARVEQAELRKHELDKPTPGSQTATTMEAVTAEVRSAAH